MNPQNPNFRKEYRCRQCNHIGPYVLKLGGLLCEKCNVIMFWPSSDEWKIAFDYSKLQTNDMNEASDVYDPDLSYKEDEH